MCALDRAIRADSQPDENIASKSLDQRSALARLARRRYIGADRAMRQTVENLLDQRDGRADFVEAHPDARIDIALCRGAELEGQVVIRRIADRAARVESAARGAADKSAACVLAGKLRAQEAGRDGSVLQ